MASRQNLAAAILLPLYYLSDATITLVWRLVKGEKFWDAIDRTLPARDGQWV